VVKLRCREVQQIPYSPWACGEAIPYLRHLWGEAVFAPNQLFAGALAVLGWCWVFLLQGEVDNDNNSKYTAVHPNPSP
jgi:hypothetical protein